MKKLHFGIGTLAVATFATAIISGPALCAGTAKPATSAQKATSKSVLLSVSGMH